MLRTNWRAFALALYFVVAIGWAPKPKIQPVAIRTRYGSVLPHEGTVTLEITVDPNVQNRGLWRAIESEDYAAASYEDLPGLHAPIVRQVQFKDLPDGNYTAIARLLQVHGETNASLTFIVGRDSEQPF